MENYFSLVMPTINRTEEVLCFIESLIKQKYKKFELIVVDQNEDDRLGSMLENFADKIKYIYIKSKEKGLSKNRNLGLKYINGNIIGFPDDDCEYDENTLWKINNFFSQTTFQIYSCGVKDKISGETFPFMRTDTFIKKGNVMKIGCSITFFIKTVRVNDVYFDDYLGVGAEFGACEESDMISELLYKNYSGKYISNDFVFHEVRKEKPSISRYYNYGKGFGAFCKKDIILRGNYFMVRIFLMQVLKSVLGILVINSYRRHHLNFLLGLLEGFSKFKIKGKEIK